MLIIQYLLAVNVYSACTSACEAVNTACTTLFKMTGYSSLLPDCAKEATIAGIPLQPDNYCNNIPTKCESIL